MVFVLPGSRSLRGDAYFVPAAPRFALHAASLAVIFDRS
jgi:hypothetical protein